MDYRLIASTVGTDTDHDAFTSAQKQWLERTRAYPRPGRLAFFVFEIECNYFLEPNWFVGLDSFETDTGLIVAGRVEDFQHAFEALPKDAPFDILSFFKYTRQKWRDFGYQE